MNGHQNFNQMYAGPQPQYSSMPLNASNQPPAAETVASPALPRPASSEVNPASLCKLGQETVLDIVYRTQVIFDQLRGIVPPNGSLKGANEAQSRKVQFQENLRNVTLLIRRLRLIYEKCNELTKNMEMSLTTAESLIPMKDDWDGKSDERKQSEAFKSAVAERAALQEQVKAVNQEIKEVLDLERRSIWEINCQLSMIRC